jgi:hypothetical protein
MKVLDKGRICRRRTFDGRQSCELGVDGNEGRERQANLKTAEQSPKEEELHTNRIAAEIDIMKKLSHPNITKVSRMIAYTS